MEDVCASSIIIILMSNTGNDIDIVAFVKVPFYS